jgi:hypothetical protein
MRNRILCLTALLAVLATPSLAKDRPVTEEEKGKLTTAMAAEGCSGGKMEFDDDHHFEVDDAKCGDGTYDLKFDLAFKLIKKERED